MIKHYNGENFNELTQNKVVVDFYANWCGPCKMFSKVVEELENDIEIDVIKVDTDKYPGIAREYQVMSIPTILLFDNNKVIKQNIGFMDKNKFKEFIK